MPPKRRRGKRDVASSSSSNIAATSSSVTLPTSPSLPTRSRGGKRKTSSPSSTSKRASKRSKPSQATINNSTAAAESSCETDPSSNTQTAAINPLIHPNDPLASLLQKLHHLSKSKPQCTAALQSIAESSSPSSVLFKTLSSSNDKKLNRKDSTTAGKEDNDIDCLGGGREGLLLQTSNPHANLIIIATFVLNNLVYLLRDKNNKQDDSGDEDDKRKEEHEDLVQKEKEACVDAAILASGISFYLSKILLNDRMKLERVVNQSTTASTSPVASNTINSTSSTSIGPSSTTKNTPSGTSSGIIAGVVALKSSSDYEKKKRRKKNSSSYSGGDGDINQMETNTNNKTSTVVAGRDARSILGRALITVACASSLAMETLTQYGPSVAKTPCGTTTITAVAAKTISTIRSPITSTSTRKKLNRSVKSPAIHQRKQEASSITTSKPEQRSKWIRRAMWSSLLSIEMVVSFQIIKQPSSSATIVSKKSSLSASQQQQQQQATFVAASSLLTMGAAAAAPSSSNTVGSGCDITSCVNTTGMHVHSVGGSSGRSKSAKTWNSVVLRAFYSDAEFCCSTAADKIDVSSCTSDTSGSSSTTVKKQKKKRKQKHHNSSNRQGSISHCSSGLVDVCRLVFNSFFQKNSNSICGVSGCEGEDEVISLWNKVLGLSDISTLNNSSFSSYILRCRGHYYEDDKTNYKNEDEIMSAMVVDGNRVSIRRWASMVFVWMHGGQLKGLEIARDLLSNRMKWDEVMSSSLSENDTGSTAKKNALSTTIPGNVALVTYVARWMDILSESGKMCGARPPTGGMETYGNFLLFSSSFSTIANAAKKSKNRNNTRQLRSNKRRTRNSAAVGGFGSDVEMESEVADSNCSIPATTINATVNSGPESHKFTTTTGRIWKRQDVRNEATVVIHLLLLAHQHCLRDNIAKTALSLCHSDDETMSKSFVQSRYSLDDNDGNLNKGVNKDATTTAYLLVNEDNRQNYHHHHSNRDIQRTEEEEETSILSRQLCKFYPHMHRTIDVICKWTGSTTPPSSLLPFDSPANSTARLDAIGSAMALRMGIASFRHCYHIGKSKEVAVVVVDARLCSMAVAELTEIVRSIIASCDNAMYQCDGGDREVDQVLIEEFSLDEPLEPNLQASEERGKVEVPCNFAGLIKLPSPNNESAGDVEGSHTECRLVSRLVREERARKGRDGDFLSFFLRAMNCKKRNISIQNKDVDEVNKKKGSFVSDSGQNRTPELLIKVLLRIVSCCYRTVEVDTDGFVTGKTHMTTFTRCTLASDCLDALRKCLCFHGTQSSAPSESRLLSSIRLRTALRKCSLTPVIINFCVELGQILELNLIQSRLILGKEAETDRYGGTGTGTGTGHTQESKDSTSSVLMVMNSLSGRFEFDQWERRLWTAHVKLCLTIARGNAAYKRFFGHKSFIGAAPDKVTVLKAIASLSDVTRGREVNNSNTSTPWPLYLSSIQHALVSTNLASDPIPQTVKEAAPEKFICDSVIVSISMCMKDLGGVLYNQTQHRGKKGRIYMSDEAVLLSLRDARLFVIALCRVPKKEQKKILSKIVDVLNSGLGRIKKGDQLKELSEFNEEISGFLARVITLCSVAVDAVASGKAHLDLLSQEIGETHYHLPSFIDMAERDIDFELSESDWYKRESCYMGVLSDWESAVLPLTRIDDAMKPLSDVDLSTFFSSLEVALDLGFKLARADRCQLIFAAWNASSKLSGWQSKEWEGALSVTDFKKCSNAAKLLHLRNDICQINWEFDEEEKTVPTSFLTKLLKDKKKNSGVTMRSSYLKRVGFLMNGVPESLRMLESLKKNARELKEGQVTSGNFIVFEATLAYISFYISMLTKTDNDFISSMLRRVKNSNAQKRKGSISAESLDGVMEDDVSDDTAESDSGCVDDFEDDDDAEAKLDGISRLHDACTTIGAAPLHPDWLDTNCQLRQRISQSTAADLAETALSGLTEFGLMTFAKYTRALQKILYFEEKEESDQMIDSLALPLIILSGFEESGDGNPTNASLWNEVVGMCNMDQVCFQVVMDEFPCKNTSTAKEAFIPNSSHRVRGKLQDCGSLADGLSSTMSEYRAAGEWELLLSETLLGACTDINYDRSNEDKRINQCSSSDSSEFHHNTNSRNKEKIVEEAARWGRVLHSTVSAMVTATALLRLSLNGGKGRKPHRLAALESNNGKSKIDIEEISSRRRADFDSSLESSQSQLKPSVSKALSFLTEIESSGFVRKDVRKCAHAAAFHLVESDSDLNNLVGINIMRNALLGLSGLSEVTKDLESIEVSDGFITVAERLIDTVDRISQVGNKVGGLNNEHASVGNLKMRLLSCLGFPYCKISIKAISEHYTDARNILSPNFQNRYSPFEWIWDVVQYGVIKQLVMISQGQLSIKLKAKGRSQAVSIVKELLTTEDYCIRRCVDSIDQDKTLKSFILQWWNALAPDFVQELVGNDLCMRCPSTASVLCESEKNHSITLSRSLCSIIAMLVGCVSPSNEAETLENKTWETVLQCTRVNIQYWAKNPCLNHVLSLLCILAARCGELRGVGSDLLSLLMLTDDPNNNAERVQGLTVLESFYRFLRDIKTALHAEGKDIIVDLEQVKNKEVNRCDSELKDNKSSVHFTKSGNSLSTCTFVVTGGDFSEQHWYNCYTCGLVWDQGCCSLCAQICHKGHDVGYSRKSSFFCDCGAEVAANSSKPPCKCLTPVSDNYLSHLQKCEASLGTNCASITDIRGVGSKREDEMFWNQTVDIAVRCFPSLTQVSLDNFVDEAKHNGLVQMLFNHFITTFEAWEKNDFARSPWAFCDGIQRDGTKKGDEISSNGHPLAPRSGKLLDVTHLEEATFSPIRAGRAHCLNPRLSTELSTDRLKKTFLSKNEIKRNIIAADYRGRLIIAEACSLMFCAALPLINTRHVAKPLESHLDRAQLCILGSVEVKFNIVGVALCPDRDRHLAVWGTAEVSVFLLKRSCDSIESKIDLVLGSEVNDCENDCLLKVEWMPSSNGRVLLVYGTTFVKVYDIKCSIVCGLPKDNCYSCRSITRYTLTYEDIVIRSGAVIPSRISIERSNGEAEEVVVASKIILLFDTGRMHVVDLSIDCNGDLEDQGENYIDCGDGLSFPTSRIRRSDGACAEPIGSTSNSLGEGSFLVYLSQSGVLLYKCVSSPLVAFTFDNENKIVGGFELLPNVLNSGVLGMDEDGHSINGPYTHWTELGAVKRGNSLFYRASFVGNSTKTNQPKLLCLEFNAFDVKIREINWPAGKSLGLGISMSTYYEGVAAFSRPILPEKEGNTDSKINKFGLTEQVCLAIVTSNGSLLFYGEDLKGGEDPAEKIIASRFSPSKRRRSFSDSALSPYGKDFCAVGKDLKMPAVLTKVRQPKFPLTIFERLINVSGKQELTFGGDGVDAQPEVAKRKLAITSNEFIMSPSKEGCTLTVTLRCNDKTSKKGCSKEKDKKFTSEDCLKNGDIDENTESSKLVIVAVRILVGSTTKDFLPKEVIVMGRSIKLTEKMKRWYDVPLTDEEIILGVRNGFVTVGIGASFDSSKNPPLVDAVEVYGQDRAKLTHLFPISKELQNLGTVSSTMNKDLSSASLISEEECNRKILNMSILSVTHVCRLLGKSVKQSSHQNLKILQRLIQFTALDSHGQENVRHHAIDLLKEVESDEQTRQMLLDEGTLLGISESLKQLRTLGLGESTSLQLKNDTVDSSMSHTIRGDDLPLAGRGILNQDILLTLDDCITSTLSIIKNRPANYRHCTENLISSGNIKSSVALSSKAVLDLCIEQQSVASTASKLVELVTLEIVIHDLLSKSENFAGFNMISDILKAQDEFVVKECCSTIVRVLSKLPFESLSSIDVDPNNGDPNVTASAYQCDGCGTFPITGTRYALEEGHDIDLCKTCFESGCTFAKTHGCQITTPVLINGKTLRLAGKEMNCGQIHQMRPVAISSIPIEQIRQARAVSEIDGTVDDDAALQMALNMSLETQQDDTESVASGLFAIRQRIFNGLLHDISGSLSAEGAPYISNPIPIIDLLLSLVFQSNEGSNQNLLWEKMSEVFCRNISFLTELCLSDQVSKVSLKRKRQSLVLCLRAIVCLLTKKELSYSDSRFSIEEEENIDGDGESSVVGEKNKEKTDPRFVCNVHGVPAVRRRCSHGEHKDRRFYVCGMERKQRCKYFKWASDKTKNDSMPLTDDPVTKCGASPLGKTSASLSEIQINPGRQSDLWTLFSSGTPPLQIKLCNLLQVYAKVLDSSETHDTVVSLVEEAEKTSACYSISKFVCGDNEKNVEEDMEDGVLQSVQKLGPYFQGRVPKRSDFSDASLCYSRSIAFYTSESSVVESSLDLLSLISMDTLDPSKNQEGAWEGWYALLCEIMNTSTCTHLRLQAKKILKRLCGGRTLLYHKVKDHYSFSFQFMSLIRDCEGPLQEALDVREKARRCGLNWEISDVTWGTLPSGGLIGVEDLVSENSHVVCKMENVSKTLDELIDATRSRVKNWRNFCALRKIPHKSAEKCKGTNFVGTEQSTRLPVDKDICDRSPICLLLWIACSLPAANQVKVFQLMDVALGSQYEDSIPSTVNIADSNFEFINTENGANLDKNTNDDIERLDQVELDSPEKMLLEGAGGLSIDDIYSFVIHFVLNGKSSPLRSIASNIACKLVVNSPGGDMVSLFNRLIAVCLRDIGPLGCECVEFLQLMNSFFTVHRIKEAVDLAALSKVVVNCFTRQMTACRDMKTAIIGNATMMLEIEKNSGELMKKEFDLACCVHCHRSFCGESRKVPRLHSSNIASIDLSTKTSSRCKLVRSDLTKSNTKSKTPKSTEAVESYSKKRLDPNSNTVSTEFSTHVQLKTRMTISVVHVSVGDPRGRFVKTIGVYFTPRHFNDINELKAVEHNPLWQRCGTLSLTRGASQASCTIVNPIVAANLKFEYEEFHEKISGARSSDGSLILHCPRCTRVVNNSHGVCGHCGEVAFQCRKCRHINYDRLDAFLCVECGYCASGTFTFEINAASASKAVAITNDEDLERAIRLLRVFSRKYSESKLLLSKKLQNNISSHINKRHIRDCVGDFGGLSNYSNQLKRALIGELPKVNTKTSDNLNRGDSQHNKKKSSSDGSFSSNKRLDTSKGSPAANKARSLLSLARQLRSEAGSSGERPSRGDLLVQQALLNSGSGSSFEIFDESDGDMLGILNNSMEGNVLQMDIPDPLSRLVANIQARVRGSSGGGTVGRSEVDGESASEAKRSIARGDDGDDGHYEEKKDDNSSKKTLEECDKLHHQMREAERDCYDLQRKIISWKRLNKDALADFGSSFLTPPRNYVPVLCAACSPSVTRHLLVLVMALFGNTIKESEDSLTEEFVSFLFDEPPDLDESLLDLKRSAIVTIAVKSDRGSKIVLRELKSRLRGSRDVAASELLGTLLGQKLSSSSAAAFEQLAVDTLSNKK